MYVTYYATISQAVALSQTSKNHLNPPFPLSLDLVHYKIYLESVNALCLHTTTLVQASSLSPGLPH